MTDRAKTGNVRPPKAALTFVLTALVLSVCAFSPASAQSPTSLVIGRSVQGRPIVASRYGSGETVVMVVGAIHGNEASSAALARYLSESGVPSAFSLWVVEVANPDGFSASKRTRGNARGVDLNRNFPNSWASLKCPGRYCSGATPASEPETAALMEFFKRVSPSMVVFYHSSMSPSVLDASRKDVHDYGKVTKYASTAGISVKTVSCGSPCTGNATEYVNKEIAGATAFVVELTCDGYKCLKSSVAARHVRAFWAAAAA